MPERQGFPLKFFSDKKNLMGARQTSFLEPTAINFANLTNLVLSRFKQI